jgi:hypothetical protein
LRRAVTILLAGLLACSALPVGALLVFAPDGSLLGATPAYLDEAPFASYLVPGLVLALLVGGSALAACVLAITRSRAAPLAAALCGTIVVAWIAVQLALITFVSPLHVITLGLGVGLAALGDVGAAELWLRWVMANAAGEVLGLGAVALGALLLGPHPAALVLLGSLAGLVVGAAQARVLRRALPALRARRWILATVLGAAVGCMAGLLPRVLLTCACDRPALGPAGQILTAMVVGALAGPALAVFQLLELRRHVRHAGWWLPANAVAWGAAMPFVLVAVGRGGSGEGWASAGALLLAAGIIAGAVTGLVLLAVLARPRSPSLQVEAEGAHAAVP